MEGDDAVDVLADMLGDGLGRRPRGSGGGGWWLILGRHRRIVLLLGGQGQLGRAWGGLLPNPRQPARFCLFARGTATARPRGGGRGPCFGRQKDCSGEPPAASY